MRGVIVRGDRLDREFLFVTVEGGGKEEADEWVGADNIGIGMRRSSLWMSMGLTFR